MTADRNSSIRELKGIGEKTAALFHRVGVFSLWDLLLHIPRDFVRYPETSRISCIKTDAPAALELTITESPKGVYVRNLHILEAKGRDETGEILLRWFNMPYLQKTIVPGMTRVFYGMAGQGRRGLTMDHPRVFLREEYEKLTGILEPVYPLTKGLTSKGIRKAVNQALEVLSPIPDYLTQEERRRIGGGTELMELETALRTVHAPASPEEMLRARKRLAFDEFLYFLYTVREMKGGREEERRGIPMTESRRTDALLSSLPYHLTGAQDRVFREIRRDLAGGKPMNRLIQGDVGSGKTIVAVLSLLIAAENGCQGVMMAPTEVLAVQHAAKISALFEGAGLPYRVACLTGSLTAAEKRAVKKEIARMEAQVVIGTHALIQEDVAFQKLGLVITDEQHRFGVRQRQILSGKAGIRKAQESECLIPHVLVMSATPIPRTLAMILYGDLDISIMDELPSSRLPVKNCVVGPDSRDRAYRFIRSEVEKGHQAYVICPQVEESEVTGVENVLDYSERLKEIYGGAVRVEALHGRMKPKVKNEIMERFASHEIDVLVSTTVVEVGVDVPNATVILIENAERFGLAALHQIRGRVGRGNAQSYCIFLNTAGDGEKNERLSVLNHSNDGFRIAEEDLKMRGPGDLFGLRQSGDLALRTADLYSDADMLKRAAAFLPEMTEETGRRLKESGTAFTGSTAGVL